MYNGTLIGAEIKPYGPRGQILTQNTFEQQVALATRIGDYVFGHTNSIWKGSFENLSQIREMVPKHIPVVAKGFHENDDLISRALDCGVQDVLVVGRQPKIHQDKCWIEPLTLGELAYVHYDQWAVWNSRDLSSLKDLPGIPAFLLKRWSKSTGEDRKRESFQEARAMRQGLLCQASNLRTVDDIAPGADAVLVGSNLEAFAASMGITL